MENINWAEAPEGATHWEIESSTARGGWMQKAEDGWFFYSKACNWYFDRVSDDRLKNMIERPLINTNALSASGFLTEACQTMADRGQQYDQPDGERSMGRAIAAFNAISGLDLTESDGWLLLQLLKDARQWSRDSYHHDSALDCVAYAALKAEALARDKPAEASKKEIQAEWPEDDARIDAIGQNGNTAEHYATVKGVVKW